MEMKSNNYEEKTKHLEKSASKFEGSVNNFV